MVSVVSKDGTIQALGNKSGSFCEAVNCEQSVLEGKFFLQYGGFHILVSRAWLPEEHWGTKAEAFVRQ